MKNINYNVLKLLHNQLDDLWRIERHYLKDVKGCKCGCSRILRGMQAQLKKNVEALKKELGTHHKMNKLA